MTYWVERLFGAVNKEKRYERFMSVILGFMCATLMFISAVTVKIYYKMER